MAPAAVASVSPAAAALAPGGAVRSARIASLPTCHSNCTATERPAQIGEAEETPGGTKQHLVAVGERHRRFPVAEEREGAVRVHEERRAADRPRRHGLRRRPQVRARARWSGPLAGRQRGAAAGGARDDGGLDLHLHVPGGQLGYAHQLRDYEKQVMEKRLESLSEAELQALLEQVEEEKQRLPQIPEEPNAITFKKN